MAEGDMRLRQRFDGSPASAAADHVRLSYHYLDTGDIDGYGSLLGERAVLRCPGMAPLCGRAAVERFERQRLRAGPTRHAVHEVIASGPFVIVVGAVARVAQRRSGVVARVDFVDVFMIADDGLITERRTIHISRSDKPLTEVPK